MALTQPMVEKNANAFEVHSDDSLGIMRADITKLRQGLFNLLSNACKFTERGKISLDVTRASVDGGEELLAEIQQSSDRIRSNRGHQKLLTLQNICWERGKL